MQGNAADSAHPSENRLESSALFERLYDELRGLAEGQLRRERPGLTLQPTALVHEAYVRLASGGQVWPSEAYFYSAAAEAMRRILVERARRVSSHKRGGGRRREELDDADLASPPGDPDALLSLHQALEELKMQDPELCEVVLLRYFAGLTVERISQMQGRSERAIKYDWAAARAWLIRRMKQGGEHAPDT